LVELFPKSVNAFEGEGLAHAWAIRQKQRVCDLEHEAITAFDGEFFQVPAGAWSDAVRNEGFILVSQAYAGLDRRLKVAPLGI
jgi:hypothetical protein